MDVLKRQTEALQAERRTNEARMMQPQNRAVLDRSKFLNTLFEKKSFSWTSVMMDLERVLPAGVQVTSIEPVITAEGDVNIRMRVSGQRELAVDLVRNLERSQRFLSPRLSNETMQTQDQNRLVPAAQSNVPGGVEFEILSGYNPLPTKSAAPDGSAGNADEQEPVALAPKAAASSAPNATNKANAGGSPKKTASSGAAKKAANGGTR
jgi:type IV pilus assembly protein PilN